MQVKNINKIRTRSQAVVEDLRTFQKNTEEDQSALTDRSTALHKRLEAEVGSLSDLETTLQNYRHELTDDIAQYEHGMAILLSGV